MWTVDGNTPDLGTHRLPVPVLPRVAQQQPGARAGGGGQGPDQRRQGQPAARAGSGCQQQGEVETHNLIVPSSHVACPP